MAYTFTNNASATLASSISATSTTLMVSTGAGSLFPITSVTKVFAGTLSKATGETEIVLVTTRAADTFTIVRAQEGTTALSFAAGDRISVRITADYLNTVADGVAAASAHIVASVGAHDATSITFTPTGSIAAINVQAALAELDSEKLATFDFNTFASAVANTYARKGVNSDITQLQALTAVPSVVVNAVAEAKANPNSKVQSVTATSTGGVLTFTLSPTTLDFRSTVASSGAVTTRTIATQLTLALSGAYTLGVGVGVTARLALLAVFNGTDVDLVVTNTAGTNNLDESTTLAYKAQLGIPSTDASDLITGGSGSPRSGAFRIVAFVDVTQSSANNWASPTLVQGIGGQSGMSIGNSRGKWRNVTSSRAFGQTNTNASNKDLEIVVTGATAGNGYGALMGITIDGVLLGRSGTQATTSPNTGPTYPFISIKVPPFSTYVLSNEYNCIMQSWFER